MLNVTFRRCVVRLQDCYFLRLYTESTCCTTYIHDHSLIVNRSEMPFSWPVEGCDLVSAYSLIPLYVIDVRTSHTVEYETLDNEVS